MAETQNDIPQEGTARNRRKTRIGVVVSAMQARWQEEQGRAEQEHAAQAHQERELLLDEVRGLREEVRALRGEMARSEHPPGGA